MNKTYQLINYLNELIKELRKSGKFETANFFDEIMQNVQTSKEKTIKDYLKKICTSGAISQYANFSLYEDELFDKCYHCAKQILIEL